MKILYSFLILLATAVGQVSFATAEEPVTMKWTIDGVERQALVFAPTKPTPGGKAPLIFGFHGHGGSMHMNSLAFGFDER